MPRSLVGIGSNLGDRPALLASAVDRLRAQPRIGAMAVSSLHPTRAIGGLDGQKDFVNAAVSLDTDLEAHELLAVLSEIEQRLGRQRGERWAARTIDLDLLLHGAEVIDTPRLAVPHPRMAFRRFVLEPAVEVAADMVHPPTGWTVCQLLAHLDRSVDYVALMGVPGCGKTLLAAELAHRWGGRFLADPAVFPRNPPALDPPSPDIGSQIEFLDARARVLASDQWPADGGLVVSDFGFDQCLAYAHVGLDAERFHEFEAQWHRGRERIVAPRLRVLLASTVPGRLGPHQGLAEELARCATRPRVGPWLVVGPADPDAALAEVAAAIEAMR
jgi:2-amino-4-hydroxy-6-hydroxymethyldihydropteridine diphosphokinase